MTRLACCCVVFLLLVGCAGLIPPTSPTTYTKLDFVSVSGTSKTQTHDGITVDVSVIPPQPLYIVSTQYDGAFFSDLGASLATSVSQGNSDVHISTYDVTYSPMFYSENLDMGGEEQYFPFSKIHFKVTITNNTNDQVDLGHSYVVVKLNNASAVIYSDNNYEICPLTFEGHLMVGTSSPGDCAVWAGDEFGGSVETTSGPAASGEVLGRYLGPSESQEYILAGPEISSFTSSGTSQGSLKFSIYDIASSWVNGRITKPFIWNFNYSASTADVPAQPIVHKKQMSDEDAKALNGKVVLAIPN